MPGSTVGSEKVIAVSLCFYHTVFNNIFTCALLLTEKVGPDVLAKEHVLPLKHSPPSL